jgi:succinoglycan biosynthesis protein ExoO
VTEPATQTISVVIPAWNAAPFIRRAVLSAASGQDAPGLRLAEIIVADDASTDDTVAVLEDIARDEPRLRILRNPRNLGPGGTRNAAIAAARGDWIAALDADDAYAPGRLPRLVGAALDGGFDIIADLPVLYDLAAGQPAPDQLAASGALQRLSLVDLLQPDPATGLDFGLLKPVFRRRLADEGLWRYDPAIRHGQDFALYYRLVAEGLSFGLLREAHYIFSTRIGAISGRYSPGSVTRVNYRDLADRTEAMARDHAARPDASAEVLRLLAARRERILRLNRIYGWTVLRKGEFGRLMRWFREDRRNLPDLLSVIGAKLRGQRGLPD